MPQTHFLALVGLPGITAWLAHTSLLAPARHGKLQMNVDLAHGMERGWFSNQLALGSVGIRSSNFSLNLEIPIYCCKGNG